MASNSATSIASLVPSVPKAESGTCCELFLWRNTKYEDGALVRCGLKVEMPEGSVKRRKILAIVLDRSGSMAGGGWRRVVNGVASVVTNKLLEDPLVAVALVVYSDDSREVPLPGSSEDLQQLLLSRDFSPQGGTCFKAAFQQAQRVIEREVKRYTDAGAAPHEVDIATLIFTDGEDTSVKGRAGRYGVPLVDKEASSRAAREAGDKFREALKKTGCSTYTCVAAFGADHDPQQCQYLSDRYYYINRSEVLSEVLSGGLGALLNSAGQCSMQIDLPSGLHLAETLPDSISLDANGRVNHHVWLRGSSDLDCASAVVSIAVKGTAAGSAAVKNSMKFDSMHDIATGSFEEHVFLIDHTALELRQLAQELCGQRPSQEALLAFRARLVKAKDALQFTGEVSSAVTGHLRGRAMLRERLAEVSGLRERLSYALGHFDEHDQDERKIGLVAIDAILRDAGQHVTSGPTATELARRTDALASLPAPQSLSKFGEDFTTDVYSCCNAYELASQGDALFFQLRNLRLGSEGELLAAEDRSGFIAHEAFQVLSNGGRQVVRSTGGEEDGFTHLGVPLYVAPDHFQRVQVFLPGVLAGLSKGSSYQQGCSERVLLNLLGRALVTSAETEAHIIALMHKARSVHAVLASTPSPHGVGTVLDDVTTEALQFLENQPGARAAVGDADLYAIAAAGMLKEDWKAEHFALLSDALIAECLRRRVTRALRNSGDAQRLCLAWGLLGSATEDDSWLDQALPTQAAEVEFKFDGFSPFTASDELDALEAQSPGKYAPREAGASALRQIVCTAGQTEALPRVRDWGMLRLQLPAWSRVVDTLGGLSGLWSSLDDLMMKEDADPTLLSPAISLLRTSNRNLDLRDAFEDASSMATIAAAACLPEAKQDCSLRQTVATALRELVERRRNGCCAFPIIGADFPQLPSHSRETVMNIWGAPAEPVDAALLKKARLRVSRRYMKVQMSVSMKEALADKEYRKRGGKFAFPSPLDTFIRGLHRRTADLHQDWRVRVLRDTSGDEARAEAVEEMLLRLRWDDRDELARVKLSAIVARIWDALEGVDLTGKAPLSSALWIDDSGMMQKQTYCVGTEVIGNETARATPVIHANVASSEAAGAKVIENTFENAATTKADVDCAEHVSASSDQSTITPRVASKNSAASELQYGEDARDSERHSTEPITSAAAELQHGEEVRDSERQSTEPITSETRLARDEVAYTLSEFIEHYGEERGQWMWDEAARFASIDDDHDADHGAAQPSHNAQVQVANEPTANEPAAPAPAVMDAGLLASFDAIRENLRESMQRFVEASDAGSRLKLPPCLTAKQRKAVHLWAEARGLGHRSFGWANRRRLHITVAGTRSDGTAQAAQAQQEEAFDWAAWANSDQEENEGGNEEWSDQEEW